MATKKRTKTSRSSSAPQEPQRPRKSSSSAKPKKSQKGSSLPFWIALVLFLIPFIVLGVILVSAAMDTGKPILGDRYKDDLDPAITSSDLSQVESAVKSVGGVESVFTNLATGTLRVYADISDGADADSAKNTAQQVYSAVNVCF